MPSHPQPVHDRALFDLLFAQVHTVNPAIRARSMFGCPAAFLGRRMVFCVFGSSVGVKLREDDAARLIAKGEATKFRPYGRPPMREWVELPGTPEDATRLAPVLALALDYARELASGAAK